MSNSRLEKFIYAICGMDIDDLPTPLSRIETLWNCLITGEVPDFKPLSRNEKYLMAMLNDNVDELPEPASRSEKLLYKIATGETDLSDVPGYLSRYEELLKQLVENGGIGGTDFEYVLYTLNQPLSTLYTTAEGPVKSAILKGNTERQISHKNLLTDNRLPINNATSSTNLKFECPISSGVYTVFITYYGNTIYNGAGNLTTKFIDNDDSIISDTEYLRIDTLKVNTTLRGVYTLTGNSSHFSITMPPATNINFVDIYVVEGEVETLSYVLQSVKMPVLTTTGKNLFHGIMTSGQLLSNNVIQNNQAKMGYSEFLPVNEELDIYCSFYTNSVYIIEKIYFYDKNKNQISMNTRPGKVTTPKGTKYFRISVTTGDWNSAVVFDDIKDDFNIQVETGIQATPYEPYKSNILSCNEEVTLRGIGDVKDTLDGNTGELTRRICEIVLDGSEDWATYPNGIQGNVISFMMNNLDNKRYGVAICDKLKCFKTLTQGNGSNEEGFVSGTNNKGLTIYISKDKASSIETFKQWLSQNPITVQYELDTESIKTVDLSITDQDGQPTKLKTFNDITHVSIEAEDLLPTVDLEVPTKIEETLSTLPTLMNDISETQQLLNESIDDQAENINEVSTAMTEIHNDIL